MLGLELGIGIGLRVKNRCSVHRRKIEKVDGSMGEKQGEEQGN